MRHGLEGGACIVVKEHTGYGNNRYKGKPDGAFYNDVFIKNFLYFLFLGRGSALLVCWCH